MNGALRFCLRLSGPSCGPCPSQPAIKTGLSSQCEVATAKAALEEVPCRRLRCHETQVR